MNLQQLDHLLALVETGSFSRAAEKLNLTQPALSRSIQMLESELGQCLIDRIGKRNELTPFGAAVAERALKIVIEARELKRSAKLFGQGKIGTVQLGLSAAPSAMLTAPLLEHVLNHFPGIRVQIMGGSVANQLTALRARSIDALVVNSRAVPLHDDLNIFPLAEIPSGFLCRQGHPLSGKDVVEFDELREYPIISTAISDDLSRNLVEAFGPDAYPQKWLHVTSDEIPGLLEAVKRTDALFVGVLGVARRMLQAGELVALNVARCPPLRAQFVFVTMRWRTEAPPTAVIRDFCEELCRQESDTVQGLGRPGADCRG
ncbi:LysR family transcriptional regulator [Cupriavidus sp. 2TAF22]|uniref:LysR family transcriptional regulator n=1 Tax=unclassified Cupriavidus TaxID=2640874 RepID=UPI003F92B819